MKHQNGVFFPFHQLLMYSEATSSWARVLSKLELHARKVVSSRNISRTVDLIEIDVFNIHKKCSWENNSGFYHMIFYLGFNYVTLRLDAHIFECLFNSIETTYRLREKACSFKYFVTQFAFLDRENWSYQAIVNYRDIHNLLL